jgi:ligand-binding sensor domain-containing protein
MKRFLKYLLFPVLVFSFFTCKKSDNKNVANLDDYSISSIVVDNLNTKWIGTNNGLYKSVDNGFELQDISDKILSLFFEKSSNTLWVGTDGGLYYGLIDGGNISSVKIPSSNLSNDIIKSVYKDSTSKKWFGTNLGFTMNKETTWKKEKFLNNGSGLNVALDIEKASINGIAIGHGNYYFATNSYGLYRAYGYNESVDAFSGASLWEAPYNGQSATDSIFSVTIDTKGNLWFGGTNGVQKHNNNLDSKSDNNYYINELPNKRVHAIAEAPDGQIWVGTENGLAVFNGNSWTDISYKLANNKYVAAIAFDADGSALIGTKQGLDVVR